MEQIAAIGSRRCCAVVKSELRERLNAALSAGVSAGRIVLDPGIGFGKVYESNYALLAAAGRVRELGRPLLSGVSRKSFLGRTLAPLRGGVDAPAEERGNATIAAVTASILAGADIVRVHDVRDQRWKQRRLPMRFWRLRIIKAGIRANQD